MKKRRIVFDITSSMDWHGADVGIIRAEKSIAAALIAHYNQEDLQFCYYSNRDKCFQAIDISLVKNKLSNTLEISVQQTKQRSLLKSLDVRKHIMALLNQLVKKVVPTSQHFAYKQLREDVRKFLFCLRALKTEKRVMKIASDISSISSFFQSDDLFVSMGLDWDKLCYLHAIHNARKAHNIKPILFCYDLIPYQLPSFVVPGYAEKLNAYFVDLLYCAFRVVAISEHVKQSLLRFSAEVGAPTPEVKVINLGCDMHLQSQNSCLHKEGLEKKDFILFVSTIEGRKNHLLAYHLWRKLVEERSRDLPMLVIAGRRGWLTSDLITMINNDVSTKTHIKILESVGDDLLSWLYRKCLFTIFPSFAEGWGLPVAESLHHGKYCIASKVGALQEVTQGLTDLLDPLDFYAWFSRITELIDNRHTTLKALEKRIKALYRPITSADMSHSFISFLESMR